MENLLSVDKQILRLALVGADLASAGAVSSHGGNLSVTDGNTLLISRTNSRLAHLAPGADPLFDAEDPAIVTTTLLPNEKADALASRELVVHRMVYTMLYDNGLAISTMACVHTHQVHTIHRSFDLNDIIPIDSEGQFTLGESVPIFENDIKIGSEEVARKMTCIMYERAKMEKPLVAVLSGHGPFCFAPTIEEAQRLASALENSCKILDIRKATR